MALQIPHDAWVFVGDGEKALFLRNEGDAEYPNLTVMNVAGQDNPATGDQGTDRPGRSQSMPGGARSAVQNADWHRLEKGRFAAELAEELYKAAHRQAFSDQIIVAPPRVLGDLRRQLHSEVKSRVTAEVGKDLTRPPLQEIERLLIDKSD